LGRLIGARGPGLIFIIPGVDKLVRISLRTVALVIPAQDVITCDNVSIKVNASTFAS
jgi:regulator of protease activity HflC (stomatin/prohibitin superfamily)